MKYIALSFFAFVFIAGAIALAVIGKEVLRGIHKNNDETTSAKLTSTGIIMASFVEVIVLLALVVSCLLILL